MTTISHLQHTSSIKLNIMFFQNNYHNDNNFVQNAWNPIRVTRVGSFSVFNKYKRFQSYKGYSYLHNVLVASFSVKKKTKCFNAFGFLTSRLLKCKSTQYVTHYFHNLFFVVWNSFTIALLKLIWNPFTALIWAIDCLALTIMKAFSTLVYHYFFN